MVRRPVGRSVAVRETPHCVRPCDVTPHCRHFCGKSCLAGFLTIGIPTVRREGVDSGYLKNTIKSLLENMSPRERTNVTLLIYVADFNTSFQDTLVNYLSAVYPSELESGLILPLLSSIDDYPSLRNLPRNFNDSERRVQWRSKQVLDFAIMFYHCQNMSEYYMQIEDDVIVAENYVSKIRDFIALQEFVNTSWVTLQFSQLGFIGKLYRSSDLRRLADFLVLFYDQMPVDWLFGRFASLLSLPKMPLRRPTLFQHQGLQSTFLSKGPNRLRDELFEGELVLKHRGDDPPVRFCSDFEQYDTYKPSFAYNRTWSMEFYWGKTIEENKTFNIRFDRPQLIKDVEIMTGHPRHTNDILQHGVLEIGFARNPRECTCSRYVQVGVFHKGHSIAEFGRGVHNRVECIRMRVTKTQSEWLIIYNIILHLWV